MTVNQTVQNMDEIISNKSESPIRIEDIFEWIDGLPVSKPVAWKSRAMARDFSDAVLMSKIMKFYYPNLVKIHNYIPANGVSGKKDNWNTLNRKVLSKIDFCLTPERIDQLSHSQIGVIDRVLNDFREKQLSTKNKECKSEINEIANDLFELDDSDSKSATVTTPMKEITFTKINESFKNFFAVFCGVLLNIICFWKWLSIKAKPESLIISAVADNEQNDKEDEGALEVSENRQLQISQEQMMQELRRKKDLINTLCHKVAFLEGTMKLKDIKIATLTNQLQHTSSEIITPFSSGSNLQMPSKTKFHRRSRAQI